MSFQLNSNITIGTFRKVKPHEVKITKGVHEYVDKAVIKVPATARLKQADVVTESTDTAKQIKEGDVVICELGYNGILRNEFTGFVSRVNFTTPVEIECEGYSYQLRKKQYGQKVFKNVQLIEILNYIISGTDIVLNRKHISDVVVTKFLVQKQSGTELLEELKKMFNSLLSFYFKNNVLCAELFPVVPFAETVYYKLGWNVIKDSSLKLKEPKNENITVTYLHTATDGTKKTGGHKLKVKVSGQPVGSGEEKQVKSSISDTATLTRLAKSDAEKQSYRGYEGKIKAFLVPYAEPAWRASITDAKFPERSGIYLIESIEVTYGMSGARRTIGIGIKL